MDRVAFDHNKPFALHIFSDASIHAYGCCVYTVQNGKSLLLTSKAKISPAEKRNLNIHMLETLAVFLGVRLLTSLLQTFAGYTIDSIHFYCDSAVSLFWVLGDKIHQRIFIRNRVKEIHVMLSRITPRVIFHHCPAMYNIADAVTKPHNHDLEFDISFWTQGPKFLITSELLPEFIPSEGLQDNSCGLGKYSCHT